MTRAEIGAPHFYGYPMKTRQSLDVERERIDRGIVESPLSGDVHQMKYLLDRAAAHVKKDSTICHAAENGNLELARLLLDGGADIHVRTTMPCAVR